MTQDVFARGDIRGPAAWVVFGCMAAQLTMGCIYRALCGWDAATQFVVYLYPSLLGGVAACVLGNGSPGWINSAYLRFLKGLLAGLVLGTVYLSLLNQLWEPVLKLVDQSNNVYRQATWIAGTTAMSTASGVFLLIFRWAANLTLDNLKMK